MKSVIALILGILFSAEVSYANTIKESMSFGKHDRCSFMCSVFRDNAVGLCMSRGYAQGEAKNCNCNENREHPNAYGDISCSSKLPSNMYGNILKLPLAGKRCSQMAPSFEYEINAKCREKGYKSGVLLSNIQCSEAENTKWAIASVRCEGKADEF
ncbi:hypothetical protein [Vibrio sp. Isolate24]|uniref:hypothetical protein n=1 Tax=Vibrio sp. Isolate24 TaxID=2908534 RepID=UPI001EFD02A8|nr:hypothetical protein [Vibrio sp. Isolate24]MCG9680627.1 hypothetical protein [Vibrio sp. Isolate24]